MYKNPTIWILVFLLGLLNLSQAYFTPLIDDEAYYWVWSKHLDWGFFDHPPMVAVWIKMGYCIFPNTLGVRLLAILSGLLLPFVWADILSLKSSQLKSFVFFFLSLLFIQIFTWVTTPDAPLLFFCSLFLWSFKRFLQTPNWKYAILMGLFAACSLYSKYHAFLFLAAVCVPLLPKLYKQKYFYITVLLTLVLYIPHLWWQFQHDFISLQYHLFERNKETGFDWEFIGLFWAGVVLTGNPYTLGVGVSQLFKKAKTDFLFSMKWASIAMFVFFFINSFIQNVQPQWLLVMWTCLLPILYPTFEKIRYSIPISGFFIVLFIALRINFMLPNPIIPSPMHKLKEYTYEIKKKINATPVFERYQKAAAYEFYQQEKAYNYRVYVHRRSQYDLWNSEQDMQGKDLCFIGLEKYSDTYVFDVDGNKDFIGYKPHFQSYPLVHFTTPNENIVRWNTQEVTLDVIIHNPYPKSIKLGNKHNQSLELFGVNPKGHPFNYAHLPLEECTVPAKSTTTVSVKMPSFLETGEYISYICIKPMGVSGKIQSEPIQIIVSE